VTSQNQAQRKGTVIHSVQIIKVQRCPSRVSRSFWFHFQCKEKWNFLCCSCQIMSIFHYNESRPVRCL